MTGGDNVLQASRMPVFLSWIMVECDPMWTMKDERMTLIDMCSGIAILVCFKKTLSCASVTGRAWCMVDLCGKSFGCMCFKSRFIWPLTYMSFMLWIPLIIVLRSLANVWVFLCAFACRCLFLSVEFFVWCAWDYLCLQWSWNLKFSVSLPPVYYADSLLINHGLVFREIDTKLIFSVSSRGTDLQQSSDSKPAFPNISSYGILISTDPKQNGQKQDNNIYALLSSVSLEKNIIFNRKSLKPLTGVLMNQCDNSLRSVQRSAVSREKSQSQKRICACMSIAFYSKSKGKK